jgi:senataxin
MKWQHEFQPIKEAIELFERTIEYPQRRATGYIKLRKHNWEQFLGFKVKALKIAALDWDEIFLSKADVIFATLSVCGRPNMSKIGCIDVLIVDEAGQSVEAEALIAIQHHPKRVILVGDTKQLPATVSSSIAKEKGYNRSLMERFELQPSNSGRILMLTEQFRMDQNICSWPSQQYYAGRLLTALQVPKNRETRWRKGNQSRHQSH